jgi:archaellum component FlaC
MNLKKFFIQEELKSNHLKTTYKFLWEEWKKMKQHLNVFREKYKKRPD